MNPPARWKVILQILHIHPIWIRHILVPIAVEKLSLKQHGRGPCSTSTCNLHEQDLYGRITCTRVSDRNCRRRINGLYRLQCQSRHQQRSLAHAHQCILSFNLSTCQYGQANRGHHGRELSDIENHCYNSFRRRKRAVLYLCAKFRFKNLLYLIYFFIQQLLGSRLADETQIRLCI